MKFRDNFLVFTLAPFIILFVSASYFRFIVIHDYVVAYEGTCDPTLNSCFIGCSDDSCSEEYYYSKVQKYAPKIYEQCGENITDCEDANICLPQNDEKCSITYCNALNSSESCKTSLGTDTQDSVQDTNNNNSDEATSDTTKI